MTASVTAATEPAASLSGLTAQELDQARRFLEQTKNAVIGVSKGLTEAQWAFKPAPDRWSIAEILAHIVMVQDRVLGPVLGQLADAPAPPPGLDCKVIDAILFNQFSNRLEKFSGPPSVHPTGEIVPAEFLARLAANCESLAARLESTPGLRQHSLESLPLRAVTKGAYDRMDGYQWILAAGAHTERHVKQILEVMADPGYPV